jgi:hypothetical protein
MVVPVEAQPGRSGEICRVVMPGILDHDEVTAHGLPFRPHSPLSSRAQRGISPATRERLAPSERQYGEPVLAFDQRRKLPDDLGARGVGQAGGEFRPAHAPVQALDLIGENDTLNGEICRKRDLEGISLGSTRDRAEQAKPDLPVVRARRDDDSGSATRLFVSRLRV